MKPRRTVAAGAPGTASRAEPMDLNGAIATVRDEVRQHATMFDLLGNVATNGASLQAAYRALAHELRAHGDHFTVAHLESADPAARMDAVSIYLLAMTLNAGRDRFEALASMIARIVKLDGDQ